MMISARGCLSLVAACLAATSRATATLVAYYSFDDGTAAEDSDSSLDGTINGATTWIDGGATDDGWIQSGTCASAWNTTDGGTCGDTQYGCPSTACDGDDMPWCMDEDDSNSIWFYCTPEGDRQSGWLYFDGTDDYVEFPSAVTADILGSAARTICLWAVIDSFSGDGGLFDYGTS